MHSTTPGSAGSRPTAGTRAARAVGWARLVAGVLLLTQAEPLVRALPGPRAVVPLARLLGLREIAQGALLAVRPTATVVRAGAVVDGLHLSTMIAAAALSREGRRAATAAAGQAAAELAADLAVVARRAT